MARKINSRLRIYGTLQAETPLHVGGYGVDVDTDLPLARNGKGELYIPGTSLTGVLRAWCEKNFNEDEIGEIFGPKREKGIEKGHASFILIEDAVVTLPNGLQTEIRDGVGIDRFYGTAADKTKFDRAILPKGSNLNCEITVEIEDRKLKPKNIRKHNKDYDETKDQFKKRISETKAIFGHLLIALSNEEIRFGASKTRGLGKVKLSKLHKIQVQDFNDILSWITLDGKGEELTDENKIKTEIATLSLGGISKNDLPKLEITICWHPTLPLMNKAGYEGIGVDMLPVTSGVADGKLSLVLAGSSIKGAFRSQAERIIRTLKPDKFEYKENFNDQIDEIDFVENLFGARKKTLKTDDSQNEKERQEKERKKRLGLGALSIDDCYAKDEFSMNTEDWRNVEQGKFDNEATFSQTELHQALKKIDGESNDKPSKRFAISHHTAIDRFTGGVAEGALYSVLAPHNIEWQPIKMSLDFGRTENDKCCLMLLLLVLRDLAENRLPLGFATNRGMGEVKVKSIKLKGKNLSEIGLPKDLDIPLAKGDVRQIDDVIKDLLKGAWEECLKK